MLARKISNDTWRLRLNRGEEIVGSVQEFCELKDIRLGRFIGLGAMEMAEIGTFMDQQRKYVSTVYKGHLEIVALNGNISALEGGVYLHPNLTASLEDLSMVGGHLDCAIVNPTCEIFLQEYPGIVEGILDNEPGLPLLDMDRV